MSANGDRIAELLANATNRAKVALANSDPDERTKELMRSAMDATRAVFPPDTGIVVLAFPFNGPAGKRTNYIGNGKREDILAALKEVVARWEGRAHDAPARKQ